MTDQLRHVLALCAHSSGLDVRTLDASYSRAARELELDGMIALNQSAGCYFVTMDGRAALGLPTLRVV